MSREQQKLMLTPQTRAKLRKQAKLFDMEMSELVEHLVNEGRYPEKKRQEKD